MSAPATLVSLAGLAKALRKQIATKGWRARRADRRRQGLDLGVVQQARRHGAVGEGALGEPEGQVLGHQRLGEFDLRIVHIVAVLVADHEHIAEALGDDQRGRRSLALDQRIGDHRGGVHDDAVHVAGLDAGLRQNRMHAAEAAQQVVMGGQRLVDGERAVGLPQHDIGEGAADIDGQGIGHGFALQPSCREMSCAAARTAQISGPRWGVRE